MTTVKLCMSNGNKYSERIREMARHCANIEVIEESCLGNCGQCYVEHFISVDGKFAATGDDDEFFRILPC